MTKEEQLELKDKIVYGLKIAYEKLLKEKREKNSELIVMQGDKIVRIKP